MCLQTCLSFLVYNWDGENADESTFLGAAHLTLTTVCLYSVIRSQQLYPYLTLPAWRADAQRYAQC